MGICEIASDSLEARVSEDGAELVGLFVRGQGHNWIWSAEEPWKRSAPLLFPVVGRLRDDSYSFEGQSYLLRQHGFARDSKFSIVDVSQDSVVLELCESLDTLSIYPFRFNLRVKYKLVEQSLVLDIQVMNNDVKTAYFSFGWHPAFVLPKQSEVGKVCIFADHPLGESILLKEGLLSEKKVLLGQNITLSKSSFQNDAWVFKDNPCQEISVVDKGGNFVRVYCGGSPSLGIWSKSPSEFICIEPWWGFSDFQDGSQVFQDKPGIQVLEAGKDWKVRMSVTVGQR